MLKKAPASELISIPHGPIEATAADCGKHHVFQFQFLTVRLKLYQEQVMQAMQILFQFLTVRLKLRGG